MKNVKDLLGSFFVFFLSGLLFSITPWAAIGYGSDYMPGELLVQPKAGVTAEKLDEIFASLNVPTIDSIPQIHAQLIKTPSRNLEKVKLALSKNPHIEYVEYNYIAEVSLTANDTYYSSQWHLPKISAPSGWDVTTGSSTVPIAIIDSGVDSTHPDLSGKLLAGYNFLYNNTNTQDIYGHGTMVAGAAAAITNNTAGIAGVARDNPIMPLLVVNSSGSASYSNIAKAITYAADHGVKVINISIAGSASNSTLQNSVNYAWNKGCIICAAAANYGTNTPYYPAAYSNAVAVSATTSSDTLASFSNYGDWIDVSAPGTSIFTTSTGGNYKSVNGTSFASPITAGFAALILSANPVLSNIQVVTIMKQSADDLGMAGCDTYYGHGRINVYRGLIDATNLQAQVDTTAPAVLITSPDNGAALSGSNTLSASSTDDVGVVKVEMYINDTLYATGNTAPYNFYWDTAQFPDGSYYLQARAYDPSGNIGQSNTITVYISNTEDTAPPTASITSPLNGSSVAGTQTINVTASDNIGTTVIELYIDGVLKSSVLNQNTIAYAWNTRKESSGTHVISVKAYDAANNMGIASVTVYK